MTEDHRGHTPISIIVNTRPHAWLQKKISFRDVIQLAFEAQPSVEGDAFTVSYRRGPNGHVAGTITAGHDVHIKEGMIFDVVRTSRS